MQQLDVDEFRRQLIEATSRSFAEAQFQRGKLYGFFLLLDAFGSSIAAIAQSEEGLKESVSDSVGDWSSAKGELIPLLTQMKRWECEDWLRLEQPYSGANRVLDTCYRSDPGEFVHVGVTRLVFCCCLEVLATLDSIGTFGKGDHRELVFLNLYVGDQSDDELLRWGVQINPHESYLRFSAELEAGHAAYQKLTFTNAKRGKGKRDQ
jgi:hypothetical protein